MTTDHDRVSAALPAYEVGGEMGRGGWGVVLEGRHRQLNRAVAIKQLPSAIATDGAFRARFVAEARLLASLDHPHIVPVYDFVEVDGLCLLVMENLPGGTLWARFTSSGVTPEAACALVLATCAGLHAAHQRGILHRDVKPENLMFSAGGALKVTDFGIAKVIGGAETMATRHGEVLGTPAYMAPEQAQSAELGPATDVYSTAVMLYEMLSSRLPFPQSGDAMATLYQHIYEQPTPLLEVAPGVPGAIAAVVMQAMATRADRRYATADDFGVALAVAATSAWGPGWPGARGHVAVTGSASILAATEGDRVGPFAPALSFAPGGAIAASSAAVRATITTRQRQARNVGDEPAILVPVREIVAHPPFPARLVAATVGLLLATAVFGLSGLGAPGSGGSLTRGLVRLNGADPAAGAVSLNLNNVVIVDGHLPGAQPDEVRLGLTLGGITIGSGRGATTIQPDGSFRATVDLGASRYLAGGRTAAMLSLLRGGRNARWRRFAIQTGQPGILTVPGLGAIAAVLFLGAYGESVLRFLRHGKRRRSAAPSLIAIASLVGCALALLAALGSGHEPGVVTMLLAAVTGGAGGLVAAKACEAVGRFRRVARVAERRRRVVAR